MMFEFRLNAAVKPSEPATLFGYGYWTIHNFLLFWVKLGILCFDNKLAISQKNLWTCIIIGLCEMP